MARNLPDRLAPANSGSPSFEDELFQSDGDIQHMASSGRSFKKDLNVGEAFKHPILSSVSRQRLLDPDTRRGDSVNHAKNLLQERNARLFGSLRIGPPLVLRLRNNCILLFFSYLQPIK